MSSGQAFLESFREAASRQEEPTRDTQRVGEPSAESALATVHDAFRRFMFLPDLAVVDVALATLVAHRLGGDPVWTLLVGPPGAGKTETIRALDDIREVHPLSALTAQTFASGLKNKPDASLLHRLQTEERSFLTLKDLTTVLTLHRDARAEIFSQLREIYDGSYRKEFGTGHTITWEGRLSFLAGVTQAIDTHHAGSALLGERFVYLRVGSAPRRRLASRALEDRGQETDMRRELRAAVRTFVEGLDLGFPSRELSTAAREALVSLADVATWARSAVARDSYSREIIVRPSPEAPTRFVKQIAGLTQAFLAMGFDEAGSLSLVERVAEDSIPPERLSVLRLLAPAAVEFATPDVAEVIGLPTTSAKRVLEDLTALAMVERSRGTGGPGGSDRWALGDPARVLWADAHREVEP